MADMEAALLLLPMGVDLGLGTGRSALALCDALPELLLLSVAGLEHACVFALRVCVCVCSYAAKTRQQIAPLLPLHASVPPADRAGGCTYAGHTGDRARRRERHTGGRAGGKHAPSGAGTRKHGVRVGGARRSGRSPFPAQSHRRSLRRTLRGAAETPVRACTADFMRDTHIVVRAVPRFPTLAASRALTFAAEGVAAVCRGSADPSRPL